MVITHYDISIITRAYMQYKSMKYTNAYHKYAKNMENVFMTKYYTIYLY